MARMPNSWARSGTSSTSILMKVTPLSANSSLNFSTCGLMALQGPHQVAKQSTTTRSLEAMVVWKSGALERGKRIRC